MPLDAFGQSGALFLVLRNLLLQLFDLRTQLIVVLEEGEVGVLQSSSRLVKMLKNKIASPLSPVNVQ